VLEGDHLGTALLTFFYFILLGLIVIVLLLFLKSLVFALIHLVIHYGSWWDHRRDVIFSFHAMFFFVGFKHLNRLLQ
jgi:hypothetical protein